MSRSNVLTFFFNDTATTEIYTLSLHDALPIFLGQLLSSATATPQNALNVAYYKNQEVDNLIEQGRTTADENEQIGKSTRLNSSHANISYAVFCLKKKHGRDGMTATSPYRLFDE